MNEEIQLEDSTKLDLFANGLKPHLRRAIRLKQPTTYQQAVRKARLLYTVQEEGDTTRDKDVKMLLDVLKFTQKDNTTTLLKKLVEQVDRIEKNAEPTQHVAAYRPPNLADPSEAAREIKKLKDEVATLKRKTYHSQTRGQRTTDGQIICNYCRRVGHTSHVCPEKSDPRIPQRYVNNKHPGYNQRRHSDSAIFQNPVHQHRPTNYTRQGRSQHPTTNQPTNPGQPISNKQSYRGNT